MYVTIAYGIILFWRLSTRDEKVVDRVTNSKDLIICIGIIDIKIRSYFYV